MSKRTPVPPVTIRTARELQWNDTTTGVDIVLQQVPVLEGILNLLEGEAASEPPAHRTLNDFVDAAVMLAREALSAIDSGATQARDGLRRLQDGAEVTPSR